MFQSRRLASITKTLSEDKFEETSENGTEWLFLVRNWRIAATVLGGTLLAAGTIAAVVRPVYESSVTFSLSPVAATGALPGETAPGDPTALQTKMQRQRAILASPEFASRLVETLGPAPRVDLASGSTGPWWERVWWKARVWSGTQVAATPAETLVSRLVVRSEPRSTVIEVRFVAFDPGVAATVANAAVDLYMQENAAINQKVVEAHRTTLARQLEESEQRLGEQLSSVQAIETQKRLEALQSRKSILERQLALLENEAAAARTRGTPAMGATPAPPSPAEQRLTDLEARQRTLLLTLGEKHPDVIALRQQIEAASAKVAAERSGRGGPDGAEASGRAPRPGMHAEMERIRQDLSAVELELLGFSLERQKLEAGAASMKALIDRQAVASPTVLEAQIVDRARPSRAPSYPRPLSILGYGLFGGVIGGIALAWIADRARSTVHTPDELKEAIRLPFLGIVPLVKDLSDGSLVSSIQDPRSGLADSFAVVRANLMFGSGAEATRVILVTGPGPGEGKSTVAAGLAIAFARTGARTLLVDADLRRPSIHGILRVAARPGLSEMLSADWTLKPPVHASSIAGLDVLVAGAPRRYSAEHLGSDEMKRFIDRMRLEYDRTVINSPPVLGLSDALVLGTLADGIVLVCSAGHTPVPAARNAVEMLSGLRTPLLGFVLNRSERRRNQYYGGGPYYTGPERRASRRGIGDRPTRPPGRPAGDR